MIPIAENEITGVISEQIQSIIREMALNGDFSYQAMVKQRYDEDGNLLFLSTDSALVNRTAADFTLRLEQKMHEEDEFTVKIPLGSVVGVNLFSGRGFPVTLSFFPMGSAVCEIGSSFEESGINQTRHLIYLDVRVSVMVILPGENAAVDFSQRVPLSENILLGKVPDFYIKK